MILPRPLRDAIYHLKKLPGVGERSALRQALTILKWSHNDINEYAGSIKNLISLNKCEQCGLLIDEDCPFCNNEHRISKKSICVVETISDCIAIENSEHYQGLYHILGGVLSPIQGIGPSELGINKLIDRVNKNNIKEVIIAINPSMEGDATSSYIRSKLPSDVLVERIGLGIPMGSNLEFFDSLTISKALENRKAF